MEEGFLSVDGEFSNSEVIEKSKFITYIKGVKDEEDAKDFVNKITKLNSLATHNCYAYIADEKGLVQKFSDDGEPQGTAGLPMLEVLKKRRIFKTCVVITRYFGGIKLGTGGLSRAYSGGVINCLDKCKISVYFSGELIKISTDYQGQNLIKNLEKQGKFNIKSVNYGENIEFFTVYKTVDFKNTEDFKNYLLESGLKNFDIEFIEKNNFSFE